MHCVRLTDSSLHLTSAFFDLPILIVVFSFELKTFSCVVLPPIRNLILMNLFGGEFSIQD